MEKAANILNDAERDGHGETILHLKSIILNLVSVK